MSLAFACISTLNMNKGKWTRQDGQHSSHTFKLHVSKAVTEKGFPEELFFHDPK